MKELYSSRKIDAAAEAEAAAVLRLGGNTDTDGGVVGKYLLPRPYQFVTYLRDLQAARIAGTAANHQSAGVEIPRYRCTPSKAEAVTTQKLVCSD